MHNSTCYVEYNSDCRNLKITKSKKSINNFYFIEYYQMFKKNFKNVHKNNT